MIDVERIMLSHRRALVTGAGAGIGEAIALGLASFGADVAALDVDFASAEATASRVKQLGRRSVALRADVREWSEFEAALSRSVDELGGLDILVNNAGGTRPKPSVFLEEADFDEAVTLNLKSVFMASQWAARRWIREGLEGVIVNVATTEAIRGCPNYSAYSAAKAGVVNLTKTLASELGPYGIRVNAVAPDYTPTPGIVDLRIGSGDVGAMMERIAPKIPLQRLGHPDDHAGAVVFLVSELASWISGQTLVVDGGSLACARVEGPMPIRSLRGDDQA